MELSTYLNENKKTGAWWNVTFEFTRGEEASRCCGPTYDEWNLISAVDQNGDEIKLDFDDIDRAIEKIKQDE